MLSPEKQPKFTKSQNKLLDVGQNLEILTSLLPKEVIEDIKLEIMRQAEEDLFTQEYQAENKNKISTGKLNLSNNIIQTTKLSKILDQELTMKERDLNPFWNNYSKEISKRLLSHQMTDLQDSDLISLNGCSNTSARELQSSITNKIIQRKNLQKTYLPSFQFTQPDITGCENINYTRKIRIYPSTEQKSFFDKCFGAHRYMYNKCIELQKKEKIPYTLPKLRKLVMRKNSVVESDDPEYWLVDIPYDTRSLAIKCFLTSIKASFSLLKSGYIKSFDMRYLSRKNNNQIFYVDKRALNKNLRLFPRRLKSPLKVKSKISRWIKNNVESINHAFSIVRQNNRYYLCLSFDRKQIVNEKKNNVVSLDPGVRTFQTFYSHDGFIGKIGVKDIDQIKSCNSKIDKLTSIASTKLSRTKRNLKKRCSLLRTKIKNIVNNLHWKAINYLLTCYDIVILPEFNTKQMSNKKNRNIGKGTTRLLNQLSHYSFKQKLIWKAKNFVNKQVIICDESFTSKTCSKCGHLKNTLGGNRIYNCDSCKFSIDRDLNGAINIFTRCLTKYFGSGATQYNFLFNLYLNE